MVKSQRECESPYEEGYLWDAHALLLVEAVFELFSNPFPLLMVEISMT